MKENDKIGYVYLTTNLLNGKQYVGQHLSDGFDKYYKGSGTYIKRALDKYGWDNFTCEVLQWCTTQTQLNEVEDNCIRLYGTMFPKGYNLKGGGGNGRYSEESRVKMSESAKKHYESNEERVKMSKIKKQFWKNKKERDKQSNRIKQYYESEENRIKRSNIFKQYYKSEEARKKQSNRVKQYYESEENRIKLSNRVKKYWESEDGVKARKKYDETMKKYWESEEWRKKQSNNSKKYYKSEDGLKHKEKMSKKVFQFTLNGEFVKEWESLSEIGRTLGYDTSTISRCCNGKYKQAYKHLWKFAS